MIEKQDPKPRRKFFRHPPSSPAGPGPRLRGPLKKYLTEFYQTADDVKNGIHGTQLTDAIYGSSVGFRGDALVELERLSKSRKQNPEDKLEFKTANFENRIYSVTKC